MTRIALVVEADADARTASTLAERVLMEQPSWQVMTWSGIAHEGRALGRRLHGHFAGQPGDCDARAARAALMSIRQACEPFHAVVLIRDADQQGPARRHGLEQAREEHSDRFRSTVPVAIGLAIPKREAWILAGFIPTDDHETQALADEKLRLGFDPTRHPEQLTASHHGAKKDIKVVTDALGIDPAREEGCLSVHLEILRQHGAATGLPEYLDEVQARLTPICQPESV